MLRLSPHLSGLGLGLALDQRRTVDRCTFKYWAAQAVSKRNHRGAGVSRGRQGDFKTVLRALSIVLLSTLNINEPLLIDLNSS